MQSTREFWAGGKRFGELFAGLRGLLLKESQVGLLLLYRLRGLLIQYCDRSLRRVKRR